MVDTVWPKFFSNIFTGGNMERPALQRLLADMAI